LIQARRICRSGRLSLDTAHGVKLWTPIQRALVDALAAAALLGCGADRDLIIGVNDFTVVKREEFDGTSLNADYWEAATHTFAPNLAWFTTQNARLEGGMLVLSVTNEPSPAAPEPGQAQKPYSAAEVRTRDTFLYGRFRARARFAAGTGVVSSFWGFYDRFANENGVPQDNQIVIEGGVSRATNAHDLRYFVNVGGDASRSDSQAAGYDPSSSFHVIGFDWTPREVRFLVDDETRLVVSDESVRGLTQYQKLVMSAYPSSAGWLGDPDPGRLPVTAEFDWVEISSYNARPEALGSGR
jgi:beta-glucanase (GH16 family)